MTVQEYARAGPAGGALRDREASRRVNRVGGKVFHLGEAGAARWCFHLQPGRGGYDSFVLNQSSIYDGEIAGGAKVPEVCEDGGRRRGEKGSDT
jgi:hypothetical protein